MSAPDAPPPPAPAADSRWRHAAALTGLLFVTSCALSLLALEAGARAWESHLSRRAPDPAALLPILRANPHGTGSYRMKPGFDAGVRVGTREVRVRTNRFGMRWREVEPQKAAGQRRVAFLGDSFTFGCWASSLEESLVGVFEQSVSPRLWEVLNFGIGGFGPADSELQLREDVLGFDPDFVILVFFNGNDFRDGYLGLDKASVADGTARLLDDVVRRKVPASDLPDDTTLATPTRARRALDGLASFRLLAPFMRLENLQLEFAVNRNFTMFGYWSQHPYPKVALDARDASLAAIGRMDALLRERGARLGIVTLPFLEQVYARERAGRDFDVAFPQLYVQAFARERGIPYIDLLPVFRERVARSNERLYLARDIHLNDAGHRLAGAAIADWFRCCVKGPRS
jgi:lysophospholipase L1-like esterase